MPPRSCYFPLLHDTNLVTPCMSHGCIAYINVRTIHLVREQGLHKPSISPFECKIWPRVINIKAADPRVRGCITESILLLCTQAFTLSSDTVVPPPPPPGIRLCICNFSCELELHACSAYVTSQSIFHGIRLFTCLPAYQFSQLRDTCPHLHA